MSRNDKTFGAFGIPIALINSQPEFASEKSCLMNMFTRIICLVLLMSAVIFLAFQTPISPQSTSAQEAVTSKAEKITGDKFKYIERSSKGASVYSVSKPHQEMLRAIDDGLSELFKIAEKSDYRYRRKMQHSDYTIYIARADRTRAGKYSPAIAISARQYAGSKYDKGGFIYVAGMVVSFNPCAFLIAEHSKDFKLVSEVVRYEGEHLVLYHNDRKYFRETADHSKGGGHPILK